MRRASKRVAMTTDATGTPFDLATVKTKADEPIRTQKRIFGIEEAPTFYPTKEEFQDPLSYIEKISPQGEKYGIIKIVPPSDYKPEFCLKTENFRFKTRIQKLNSMEGETRTNVNYLEQLTKYHILTGRPVGKIPQLDKRPIDLYKLKNEVSQRGGVQEVTRQKKWAEIGRVLGYSRKQCTSMSNALKSAYSRVVLPYEIWFAKHKDDVEHILKKEEVGSITSTLSGESDICEVCQKNENEEKLLLCDGCNRGYHMYCLSPPLSNIPRTDWYCLQCLTAVGKDYGFEDGEEYTLSEFHKVCDKFKKEWFEKSLEEKNKPAVVTEEECENEFWRLVENPHETCEVEYGADLHSTQHGSGFMAAEQMPKGAFDPWNLNVIPVAPKSLFTHIKTDISGMMVPWLYVGMCFSAFCWHNEDHYTYSVNYMHWGETKTWYGVPGSDTAKFEETMKKAVPELFEQQPDLLFQLVTMLSPGRLVKENVKVYAVDQRPGQFVVTYPKAYHSGFNHGFNFCEAVNFAPSGWVDYGLECVKRYKEFRRQPCFSHDELLVTAAQNIKATPTDNLEWLSCGLIELQNRELKERSTVRSIRKLKEEPIPENDTNDREELQCTYCNCYTYLSYIGCACTDKVACLDHLSELCSCDISQKALYTRFTDKQLDDMVQRITKSNSSPEDWIQKLDKAVTSKPGPTIKSLKELLKEGHDTQAPQYSLDTLKDYIDTVESWLNEAEKVLSYKSDSSSKPSTKKRDERVRDLIEQANTVGYDLPHLEKLKTYAQQLEDFYSRLTVLVVTSNDADMQNELYNEGLHLRADSVIFMQLRNLVESGSWEEQVEKTLKSPFNPKTIHKLISDAESLGITHGPLMDRLAAVEERGKDIVQRIDNICRGKEKISLGEEESILNIGQSKYNDKLNVVLEPHLMSRLINAMTKSKQTIREIENVMNSNIKNLPIKDRPSIVEAQRLMAICRELCFKCDFVPQLSHELTKMSTWNDHVRITFMNGRQKSLETVIRETLSNVERITSSEAKTGLWCVCRKSESGLMIECDVCREWYHSSCLKIPRNVVRSSMTYVCPICHHTDSSKRVTAYLSKQPKLEEISDLITNAESLMFQPKDHNLIKDIHDCMQKYRDRVQAFCRSKAQLGIADIQQIKYYLRTLTGLEISLQDETDFLRAKVESLMPVSVPKEIDSEPSNTTSNTEVQATVAVASVTEAPPATLLENTIHLPSKQQGSIRERKSTTTPNISKRSDRSQQSSSLRRSVKTLPCCNQAIGDEQGSIGCDFCGLIAHRACCTTTEDYLFKCIKCMKPAVESTNLKLPRSTSTKSTLKRKTSDETVSQHKPQKIIKLTVKPPSQPVNYGAVLNSNSLKMKRQYTPEEGLLSVSSSNNKHKKLKNLPHEQDSSSSSLQQQQRSNRV